MSGASVNNIYKFSSYLTGNNTSRLKSVNGVVVNNTAYCDNHTKTMHALCRKRGKTKRILCNCGGNNSKQWFKGLVAYASAARYQQTACSADKKVCLCLRVGNADIQKQALRTGRIGISNPDIQPSDAKVQYSWSRAYVTGPRSKSKALYICVCSISWYVVGFRSESPCYYFKRFCIYGTLRFTGIMSLAACINPTLKISRIQTHTNLEPPLQKDFMASVFPPPETILFRTF